MLMTACRIGDSLVSHMSLWPSTVYKSIGEDHRRDVVMEKNFCRSSVISSDAESESTSGYPPTPDSEELAEELEYGPGIVNKLRTRFLSISLKQNRGTDIRRSCSMENLLDQDCPTPETAPVITQKAASNQLKRAKSMDTLLMDLQQSEAGNAKVFKGGLGRQVPTISDEEFPKPDIVKTYKRMFEPAESRRGSHCRRPPVLRASAKSSASKTNGALSTLSAQLCNGALKGRTSAKQLPTQINGDSLSKNATINGDAKLNGCHTVKATPLKITSPSSKTDEKPVNGILSRCEAKTDIVSNESEAQKEISTPKTVEENLKKFDRKGCPNGIPKYTKPKVPPNRPSLKPVKTNSKFEEHKVNDNFPQIKLKPVNGYKKATDSPTKSELSNPFEFRLNNRNKSSLDDKRDTDLVILRENNTGKPSSPIYRKQSGEVKPSLPEKLHNGIRYPLSDTILTQEIKSPEIAMNSKNSFQPPINNGTCKGVLKSPSLKLENVSMNCQLVNNKDNIDIKSPLRKNSPNNYVSLPLPVKISDETNCQADTTLLNGDTSIFPSGIKSNGTITPANKEECPISDRKCSETATTVSEIVKVVEVTSSNGISINSNMNDKLDTLKTEVPFSAVGPTQAIPDPLKPAKAIASEAIDEATKPIEEEVSKLQSFKFKSEALKPVIESPKATLVKAANRIPKQSDGSPAKTATETSKLLRSEDKGSVKPANLTKSENVGSPDASKCQGSVKLESMGSPKGSSESSKSPSQARVVARKASPTSATSMVFDFRGKDVVSHVAVVPAPFGCKPAPKTLKKEGPEDEDEDSVDYSVPLPCGLVFEGENVRVGRGSILSKRNKDLKIQFVESECEENTFVYPSETSLLEDAPAPDSSSALHPHPAKLRDNAGGLSSSNGGGGLSAYTPSSLRAVESFEPGMFRCEPALPTSDEPAQPLDLPSSWSASSGSSDLLF